MTQEDRHFWKLYALAALLALVLHVGLGGLLWSVSSPAEQALLAHRAPLLGLALMLLLFGLYGGLRWLFHTYLLPVRRLADEARVMAHVDAGRRLPPVGGRATADLASALNEVAEALEKARANVAAHRQAARGEVERERTTLAALMAWISEGVLICNIEGQILLYNQRVHQLLIAEDEDAPGVPAKLIGLGRSVFNLIDRNLITHALDDLRHQFRREASRPVSHFTTAIKGGPFLRVRVAPVLNDEEALQGFVLVLSHAAPLPAPAARNGLACPVSSLDPMLGADLLDALVRRARQHLDLALAVEGVRGDLWVRVDSYATVRALLFLLEHLKRRATDDTFALRLHAQDDRVCLDVVWSGLPLPKAELGRLSERALPSTEVSYTVTLQDVLTRHDATLRLHEVEDGRPALRLCLPTTRPRRTEAAWRAARPRPNSRPVFYDLDLLDRSSQSQGIEHRRLREVLYTVFDTETTGLNPQNGDEIIAIGAVRLVNGRLLREETFDQLVDPRRPLSLDAVRVHGIQPAMLHGKPPIRDVLPSFKQFVEDTVLLGHNVAFDLRFLEMKEKEAGVCFSNPVLDTLLLAAVVYPDAQNYGLDALAERFGLDATGRHTALGDALITGEIFLKLVSLLEQRGIRTLGAARAASQQTKLAKLKY